MKRLLLRDQLAVARSFGWARGALRAAYVNNGRRHGAGRNALAAAGLASGAVSLFQGRFGGAIRRGVLAGSANGKFRLSSASSRRWNEIGGGEESHPAQRRAANRLAQFCGGRLLGRRRPQRVGARKSSRPS